MSVKKHITTLISGSVRFFLASVEVSLPDDSAELDVFLNVLLVPAAFQVVK